MKYLIPILLLFSSCYTAKKAEQQVNKADSKFPEVVAKLARDKYPCTDLLKPDTAILYKDTTVYIDCPEGLTSSRIVLDSNGNYIIIPTGVIQPFDSGGYGSDLVYRYQPGQSFPLRDTVNNTVVRTVRVPVTVKLPGQTITRWYEDSAKLKLAAVEYNRVVKANEGLQDENEKLSGKLKHANTENWIWRLIASALIIWQLFKLYKRFTTLKIF